MSSAGSVWYVGSFELCLLLLNVAESDIDCLFFFVEGCGVSSAEYCVHLVSV